MKVRFTQRAQRDLTEIYDFVSQDSPAAATRLVASLVDRGRQLGDHPLAGRQTDEPDARVVVVPRVRYFIFYMIAADEIHVTHIRHTSRQRPRNWGR